jgi:periplasmic divalent cation tolerance protein
MSPEDIVLILVTAGSQAEAQTLAHTLVSEGLAACVNLWPVTSVYRWQGQMEQAEEYQMLIKTCRGRLPELATSLYHHHAYEVPEFLGVPCQFSSEAYGTWLRAQVSR